MCDAASSTRLLLPNSGFGSPNSSSIRRSSLPKFVSALPIFTRKPDCTSSIHGGSQLIGGCSTMKSANSPKVTRNPIPAGSGEFEFYAELGFKEREKERVELKIGSDIGNGTDENGAKSVGRLEDEELVRSEEGSNGVCEITARRIGRRQQMKRSNMLAKQVISVQSALSLGFVSQLWVDTSTWVVLVVEVRPTLLSGELERFFLEDVSRVGDVVLIQDEIVMESELNMIGLETLVGYNVVTPGQRSIGKVRGYTFNINSGGVESLELDSFGVSIIPSSLVSTYALLVEDVLEVVSDTIVVHEAAASRIQWLTKGFWGSQKLGKSIDEVRDCSDLEREHVQFDDGESSRKPFISRKFRPTMGESIDDWELPMDYL